jgi:hypothetical protein
MSRAERISAVIVVISGGFVAAYSYYTLKLGTMISPGAGFVPFLLGTALIILGTLWFIQKSRRKAEVCVPFTDGACVPLEGPAESVERVSGASKKMLLGIVLMIAYAVLFERIGYFPATVLFMLGWQILVEKEKLLKSVLITAIAAVTMYTVFSYLLGIFLPKGTWF